MSQCAQLAKGRADIPTDTRWIYSDLRNLALQSGFFAQFALCDSGIPPDELALCNGHIQQRMSHDIHRDAQIQLFCPQGMLWIPPFKSGYAFFNEPRFFDRAKVTLQQVDFGTIRL